MRKQQALWLLAFILWGAFALRLYRLDFQDIWWDEARNIDVASRPLAQIATAGELDIHPPLYFYLLHGWMRLAGESPFAIRFLSTAFGLLTLPLLYQLGRAGGGRLAGALAAAVGALAPFALGEAQEARMYTMAFAWLCLAGWSLWRAIGPHPQQEEGSKDWAPWAGFALFSALSLLTHYSTAFVVVAFALFIALRWLAAPKTQRRPLLLRAMASGAVIVLLFLPQAAIAWRQIPSYRNPNLMVPSWWEYLARCWHAYSLGPHIAPQKARPWLWGIGALLVAGLALVLWHSCRVGEEQEAGSRRQEARGKIASCILPPVSFLLSWLLLPLALYYWVLLDRATFDPRYISFVAPAYWTLLGMALAAFWRQNRPLGAVTTGFLLAALAVGVHSDLTDASYFSEDTSGLAAWLEETATPDDLILVDQRYPFGFYYERWNNRSDGFPPAKPAHLAPAQYLFVDINTLDRRLTALAAGKERVFWAEWYKSDTDPRGAVDFLLRKFGTLLGERGFRGYRVRWYRIAPDTIFELAPPLQPLSLAFDGQVGLEGWVYGGRGPGITSTAEETRAQAVPAGRPAWAVLRWRQLPDAERPLKVSLRLVGEDGRLVGQDDRPLLNDRHLTLPHWSEQDRPLNVYLVEVKPDTPAGTYLWQIVVYDPETLAPLPWRDREGQPHGEPATLGSIRVFAGSD
ncbi:MAG: glycosyltransferase family 39 protein [Anaerolineae bacterium]|nr:glycosyltransferase family 39 protein [Anaerolineae bacterium]